MSTVEREWRNRQTRTFEGRVGRLVRVQVPSLAPKIADTIWYLLFFLCEIFIFEAIILTDSKKYLFLYSIKSFSIRISAFSKLLLHNLI